jgi:hypothetical protein
VANFGIIYEIHLLISYNSQKLQEICFSSSVAVKSLGEIAAECLRDRHSDFQAAGNVYELPIGQVDIVKNVCTLTILNVLTVVMTPNYTGLNVDSHYDWETVRRVKVMEINGVT